MDDDELLRLSDLTQKDRIQILLAEYNALRNEIVARTGYGFQTAAAALVGVTFLFNSKFNDQPWYFWPAVLGVAICIGLAIFVNTRDLKRAASRLIEIEHEVNSRAGEHLLIWEKLGGVTGQTSLTWSFITMVRTLPRSKLPALDSNYLKRDAALARSKMAPREGS
jgi:hypothetical protein